MDQSTAIEDLTGKVLDALLSFVVEHLRPGADQDELELLDYTQEPGPPAVTSPAPH